MFKINRVWSAITQFVTSRADTDLLKGVQLFFPDKDGNSHVTPLRGERVTHVARKGGNDGVRFARFLPQKQSSVSLGDPRVPPPRGHKSNGVKSITTSRPARTPGKKSNLSNLVDFRFLSFFVRDQADVAINTAHFCRLSWNFTNRSTRRSNNAKLDRVMRAV